ncbi:MAG: hypothetical protein ABWW69_00370 [Pyrodictiaceae archaeon]
MSEYTIGVDLAKYKYVDLELDEAKKFINALKSVVGRGEADFREVGRYLENFDEFYNYMKKKFKDFLAVPHKPDDYIRSNVVVDKVKLYIDDNGKRRVVLVLDRSVSFDEIKEALKALGYHTIKTKKLF